MIKKFKSRYGDERTITLLEDGSYKVEGRSLYTRHGDGLFDFEGGPCYIVGERFLDGIGDLIIDSVNPVEATQDDWGAVIVTTKKIPKRKKNVKVS